MDAVVLCYNLEETEKGKKIEQIFRLLGCRVRHVKTAWFRSPLGVLTGIASGEENSPPYFGAGFSEEMLVMHLPGEEIFKLALQMMKREQAVVELKAILTPYNMKWDSIALYEELCREREAVTSAGRGSQGAERTEK
ncbi:MAG: DUF3783 domain-containing protein [Eubacteriales bacterium]|nr:DUF3783 domain-containing protein [Eubacteriales bacterium]